MDEKLDDTIQEKKFKDDYFEDDPFENYGEGSYPEEE